MNKRLLIIDLENDLNITEQHCDYLQVNLGNLSLKNCKKIKYNLNDIYNKSKIKNKLITSFYALYTSVKKKIKRFDPIELEVFNLRNDKVSYISKLILISIFKAKIKKKYQKIEIYSDDENYLDLYKKIFKNPIIYNCNNKKKKEKTPGFFQFIFRQINFFIKSMFLVLLLKFFYKKNIGKNKNLNFSIYPIFFKKNKNNLYFNNYQNINMTIGDETQLSLGYAGLLKTFLSIKKNKTIIPLEAFIKIRELLLIFCLNLFEYKNSILGKKIKIKYENVEIKNFLNNHYHLSYLNRLKLEIYNNAIDRVLKLSKCKQINYYMFEYNLGFYFAKRVSDYSKEINKAGYQHGIFTKNCLWLEIISKIKKNKDFIPNKIFFNNFKSYLAYKNKIKNIKFVKNHFDKSILNSIKKLIVKKSNEILVIFGLHDQNMILKYLYNLNKSSEYNNKTFYLKLHPKSKLILDKKKLPKNFIILNKINYNKKYTLYISQTSSLLYNLENIGAKCRPITLMNKINLHS